MITFIRDKRKTPGAFAGQARSVFVSPVFDSEKEHEMTEEQ